MPTLMVIIVVLAKRDSLEMAYLVVLCCTFCFLQASSLQNKMNILGEISMHLRMGSHDQLLNKFGAPSN